MLLRTVSTVFATLALAVAFGADAGSLSGPATVSTTPTQVVEFYNAALDHYFVTADTAEAYALDSGAHQGWVRTGFQFTAFTSGSVDPQLSTVCRFYGRPEAGLDSHFYSGSSGECVAVVSKFASSWQFESGDVFRTIMPNPTNGSCPGSTLPVYRMFNNRRDANHRYTTDPTVRSNMLARGYIPEGYGADGVALCATAQSVPPADTVDPAAPIVIAASILANQVAPDTYDFSSSASASNGAAIVSYAWNFGDGTTALGPTASHTYTAAGTFPVVLTVLDNKGAAATASKSVAATLPTTTPPPPVTTPTPPATPTPPTATGYVGPSNAPDLWSLEMTDYASLTAQAGYSLDGYYHTNIWASNPEFGTDALGIKYLRFTNDPAKLNVSDGSGSALISWFMPLGAGVGNRTAAQAGRDSVNVRYLLWIEDDVAGAFNELGMKLPGPSSENGFGGDAGGLVSWRTWHGPPVNNAYAFKDYLYDSESGSSYPLPHDFGVTMQPKRWYSVEVRAQLNTVGLANGYGAVWVDGKKVYENAAKLFRTDPATKLRAFHVNVYHGGLTAPKGLMHYRIAKLAASSSYIGVPAELLGTTTVATPSSTPAATPYPPVPSAPGVYPAWRQGRFKDVPFGITGTGAMAGNMPGPTGGRPVTGFGKSSWDISSWTGFAADTARSVWWGVAQGGDGAQWTNKAYKVDLSQDAPRYILDFAGTSEAKAKEAGTSGPYYHDGLPQARQTYYTNQFVGARNRVFMVLCPAPFSLPSKYDVMDAYVPGVGYDPAGTWPSSGIIADGGNTLVHVIAKHPVTEDIYITGIGGVFKKWTQATGTWSTVLRNGKVSWGFHGSVIDAGRNRWVYIAANALESLDLSTWQYTSLPITGVTIPDTTYSALVHDVDNDRYLLFVGDSNVSPPRPGEVYAVNPATGAASKLADVPAPMNGWNSRVTYFPNLGGVAYLPYYDSNILFMPTR